MPHAGSQHGETVCCAGLTPDGEWRRQFPVRFRQLRDKFKRWEWIEYEWRPPKGDSRPESRRVQEGSIKVLNELAPRERAVFLDRVTVPSTAHAEGQGRSLALIRPRDTRFYFREKSHDEIEKEAAGFRSAAANPGLFDKELAELKPCPFEFRFDYETADGRHDHECADWETAAMFYGFRKRYGTEDALSRMSHCFNVEYRAKGMAFAMGTHSRWRTWLLVGVIRVDEAREMALQL